MANRLKGEVEISLGGNKILLRPSFEALLEIEDKSGMSIAGILVRAAKGEMPIRAMAAVIYGGLVGSENHDFSFNQVGEEIMREGLRNFFVPCAIFLSNAMKSEGDRIEEASEKKELAG